MHKAIGICVAGLLLTSCRAQESVPAKPLPVEVQRTFEAEEALRRPEGLPDEVLLALRADERNRTCIPDGETDQVIRKEWFGASQIDLNSDNRADLVIVPINGCLYGANIVPFWVFRNTEAGYELVSSTHGLSLEGMRLAVTLTYKFNGSRYEQSSRREEEIR